METRQKQIEVKRTPLFNFFVYEYTLEHTDFMPEYEDIKCVACNMCGDRFLGDKRGLKLHRIRNNIQKIIYTTPKRKSSYDLINHFLHSHNPEYYKHLYTFLTKKSLRKINIQNIKIGCLYCKKIYALKNILSHLEKKHHEFNSYLFFTQFEKYLSDKKTHWEHLMSIKSAYNIKKMDSISLGMYKIVIVHKGRSVIEVLVDNIELKDKILNCKYKREIMTLISDNHEELSKTMCDFEDKIKTVTTQYLGGPKECPS